MFLGIPHSGDKESAPLLFILSGRSGLKPVSSTSIVNAEKPNFYEVKIKR